MGWWAKVFAGTALAILAALAVTGNRPHLSASVKVSQPKYSMSEDLKASFSRDKALKELQTELIDRLHHRTSLVFAAEPGKASEQSVLQQEINSERLMRNVGWVQMDLNVTVTNTGGLPSTITSVETSVVEEVDGSRRIVQVTRDEISVKVDNGVTVPLSPEPGRSLLLKDCIQTFVNYEILRLLEEQAKMSNLSQNNRIALVSDLAHVMTLFDPKRQEVIVDMARSGHRYKLLIVVDVYDVYNRRGTGEALIFDTAEWFGGNR
jgi:hypothetical protein